MNKELIIALLLVCMVVLAIYITRDTKVPRDYCEKVHHISHQDYLDCKRAVEAQHKNE